MTKAQTIDGTPVRFDRRRYGRTVYTWVEAMIGGGWVTLGEPWSAIPSHDEIAAAIDYFLSRNGGA